MRVMYHPHAETELIEAAKYYESRIAGLGKRFLEESDNAVSMIREGPRRWRILEVDVRRYLMPHFPFAIYYRVLPDPHADDAAPAGGGYKRSNSESPWSMERSGSCRAQSGSRKPAA